MTLPLVVNRTEQGLSSDHFTALRDLLGKLILYFRLKKVSPEPDCILDH